MIYTPMTNRAMCLAYEAHLGQKDKSGQPYIFHPYHLAEQMKDEVSVCAALLHDVVEDTSVTLEELREQFPEEVTEAVRLLTHEEGTDYFDYIRAVRQNPVAKAVKLADIAHNSDETRFAGCEDADTGTSLEFPEALREKYRRAKAILLDLPPESGNDGKSEDVEDAVFAGTGGKIGCGGNDGNAAAPDRKKIRQKGE